jgi:hypothetical protein
MPTVKFSNDLSRCLRKLLPPAYCFTYWTDGIKGRVDDEYEIVDVSKDIFLKKVNRR